MANRKRHMQKLEEMPPPTCTYEELSVSVYPTKTSPQIFWGENPKYSMNKASTKPNAEETPNYITKERQQIVAVTAKTPYEMAQKQKHITHSGNSEPHNYITKKRQQIVAVTAKTPYEMAQKQKRITHSGNSEPHRHVLTSNHNYR